MKFIVLPISDARIVFSEDELAHMRKNVDETEVIAHEEILIEKRNAMGLTTLQSEDTGQIEWAYPVYEYNSQELNSLLNSSEWNNETVKNVQTSNISIPTKFTTASSKTTSTRKTTKTTSAKIGKSYWNF